LIYTIVQHRNLLEADDSNCPAVRTLFPLPDMDKGLLYPGDANIVLTEGYPEQTDKVHGSINEGETTDTVKYSLTGDGKCENVYINSATYNYDQAKLACETLCQEHDFDDNRMCTIKEYDSDKYGKIPDKLNKEDYDYYLRQDDDGSDQRRNGYLQPSMHTMVKKDDRYAWKCTEGAYCDDACDTTENSTIGNVGHEAADNIVAASVKGGEEEDNIIDDIKHDVNPGNWANMLGL
jgi:hypothetical protein